MKEETRELLRNKLGAADVKKEDIDLIVNEVESAEYCTVYVVHDHATHQISWRVITDALLDEVVTELFHDLVDNLDMVVRLLIYKLSEEEGVFQIPVTGLNACAADLRLGVKEL